MPVMDSRRAPGLRGQGCWMSPGARDTLTQCGRKATYVPTDKLCFQSEHRAKNPQRLHRARLPPLCSLVSSHICPRGPRDVPSMAPSAPAASELTPLLPHPLPASAQVSPARGAGTDYL